mmetsp:Transcript_100013/g.288761  ORF Transcript_100013/g.288761 Transcript_100013/m.288761 type:complete len:229 (+) Transcript_100013:441-1127(+)
MSSRSTKFIVLSTRSRTSSSPFAPVPPNHSERNGAVLQLSISLNTVDTHALACASLAAIFASSSAVLAAWRSVGPPAVAMEVPRRMAGKIRNMLATRTTIAGTEYGLPQLLAALPTFVSLSLSSGPTCGERATPFMLRSATRMAPEFLTEMARCTRPSPFASICTASSQVSASSSSTLAKRRTRLPGATSISQVALPRMRKHARSLASGSVAPESRKCPITAWHKAAH